MHHHDALAPCARLHKPDVRETFSPMRMLRRAAGLLVLIVVLPVFLLGMAVALPVALLVGGLDAVQALWQAARRQMHLHHGQHHHAPL
jgi:hypothetical protein